jgi:hypothetical protein
LQRSRQLDIDGAKVRYNDQSVWAGVAILTGLPATATPIGRTDLDISEVSRVRVRQGFPEEVRHSSWC